MTLEKQQFQHLLFKVAFCTITCDGHIDEMEIKEMKALDKASIYFKDIDLSDELDNLVVTLKEKGKHIIDDLYAYLKATKLSPVQELLILEVAFRLSMANKEMDENEIKFIRFLRSHLDLHDEIYETALVPLSIFLIKIIHRILLKVKPIVICFRQFQYLK